MSFSRYPSYRNSAVEWLGAVPAHWQNQTLNSRFSIELGKMLDESRITGKHLVPYLRNVDVQWDAINFEDLPKMDINEAECSRYTVAKGDLLVCEGGEVGRAAIVTETPGMTGFQKALHRLRPRGDDEVPRFMYYTLVWAAATGILRAGGSSTIAHLTGQQLRKYRFPKPPVDEQKEIVTFLDRETAKIDMLVAEQQQLIALLKEKRQSVISHAVSKGSDPAAPMKESRIAWLGEVPKHWKVLTLGKVTADRCDGPFGSGLKSDHYTDQGIRVIRLQNIRQGAFDDADSSFIDEKYYREELNGHDVVAGDLLIAGLGDDRNTVGRACVAPSGIEPAMVKADCFRFRLDREQVLPEFVAMQLTAGSSFDAGMLSSGSTRARIPLSVMASRMVALPPVDEQQCIVSFLHGQSTKYDALTAEAQIGISLLQERRAALISSAVTGDIDVRGLVATSPESEAAA